MNKKKEINIILSLKNKLISVNDLYKAGILPRGGKQVPYIYKNPRAKTLEADAIAQLLTGTASTQADCTEDNVYSNIVKDIAILAKKGIPKERMYVAIDYATETLLLTDEKYSNTASQIGAELAREGVVGRINGVNVIVEDLGKDSSEKPIEYFIYGVDWCQAIDEWQIAPDINDLKDGAHIGASALQGRMVYADKVTNTEAVIVKKKSA